MDDEDIKINELKFRLSDVETLQKERLRQTEQRLEEFSSAIHDLRQELSSIKSSVDSSSGTVKGIAVLGSVLALFFMFVDILDKMGFYG